MNYRKVSEASRAAYFKAKAELGRHLPVLPFFAGWNAAKYQFTDASTDAGKTDTRQGESFNLLSCVEQTTENATNPQIKDSDLYSWLDTIVHEALPHNYENLNPRELRELFASALYERLTEDKDFQSTYVASVFQPKEITIDVDRGAQGFSLMCRPTNTPWTYNAYRSDGSLYASNLTLDQIRSMVLRDMSIPDGLKFGETK